MGSSLAFPKIADPYLGVAVEPGVLALAVFMPMASPERTSSTRRFCWRPSGVSLVATGWVLPKSARNDAVARNALLHQIVADGTCALF